MSQLKKIKSALISVFNKENLEPIIKLLRAHDITIYSTGGTQEFIEGLGESVIPVEDVTSYPSILGGRVKTLHPKIFGGILSRRELKSDVDQLEQYEIPSIDLVVVDLYPFEKTVLSNAAQEEIIEKIDIGGISLIRAAAKNYKDVLIIPSLHQYEFLASILKNKNAETTIEERKLMAAAAFQVSSHYDSAIYQYFSRNADNAALKISVAANQQLRYGENPHQKGMFYGDLNEAFEKISGKELSYNNLLDANAAVQLIADFKNEITFAIIKHNNACGIASRDTLAKAWSDALACDPVSAFGGVLITNTEIDSVTATEINKLFFEILIAPGYTPEAIEILIRKPNRIVLRSKDFVSSTTEVRTALNGFLVQEKDVYVEQDADFNTVTKVALNKSQLEDLKFANKIVKHSKSNAIILAHNKQLLASGVGQTSRVDALKHAIEKAKSFGFNLQEAVMASDAFFPFPDCVEIAASEGIKAIVQPGGSIKDKDSIDACDRLQVAMALTGKRHFKH